MPSPLAPLTAEEHHAARRAVRAAGLLTPTTRFAYLGLAEPPKADVLAGTASGRRARAMLLDTRTGQATDLVADLVAGTVERATVLDPATTGGVPQLLSEMAAASRIAAADPRWTAALEARGVDPAAVQNDAFTAGHFDFPDEVGRRVLRVLPWVKGSPTENYWAHPVDGLVAYVDVVTEEVLQLIDTGGRPVPTESGDFMDPTDLVPAPRLQPLEITQPEGPSFTVDGDHRMTWDRWTLQVGFDMREGLVLHQLAFAGRPVVHRASIAEMVVPYGDPHAVRFWTNYFDTGEYLVGRLANSLMLGCDCLGEIHYLDVVVAGEDGAPITLPNAVCIHEEDVGTLWKHTEADGRAQVRRSRRLVVSYVTTVGNYDYGFYWYLYQDGRIGHEAKLNGIVFTTATGDGRHSSPVAPGLAAPFHQHLFCARLDMAVDGPVNRVEEVDVVREPIGPGNEHGNAFTRVVTTIRDETDAARMADPLLGRVWRVVNPQRRNRVGLEVGYVLVPQAGPTLMAAPESSIARRAAFATRHLWITAHDDAERYPAGDFVNQSPGGQGLPAYQAAGRDLDGADVVLWHTFGPTHFPRAEDWPVMPTDHVGFELRPDNFFDRNPALDAAPPVPAHACATGHRAPTIYTLDASQDRGIPLPPVD